MDFLGRKDGGLLWAALRRLRSDHSCMGIMVGGNWLLLDVRHIDCSLNGTVPSCGMYTSKAPRSIRVQHSREHDNLTA